MPRCWRRDLRFLPIPPLIDNYVRVLGEQAGPSARASLSPTTTAIVSLLIAAPAAYALVVFRLRWLTVFVLLLLVVQMIPHVVVANALYAIYARAGLLNTHLGLILADATMGVPFAILILRAFMVSLPRSLIEAALVDGATHWGAFTRIILPLSRNGLITSGLFCFLFALVGLPVRADHGHAGQDRADHAGHLQIHRQREHELEHHHGRRRAGLHPADRAAARRPALHHRRLVGGAVKE